MIEVFTFGEAMIRFSVPPGEDLETAGAFAVDVAGSEANVAHALARLGRSVAWWSRLPENPLGRRIRGRLMAAGVDCSSIALESSGRVGTYYVALHPPPRPTAVLYDRAGSLASMLAPQLVPWERVEEAKWVHVSGITPALSASCLETTRRVVQRGRDAGAVVSFDVNYRAKLWDVGEAAPILTEFARAADVVICARRDAVALFGMGGTSEEVCAELARWSADGTAVVTDGAHGAWWVRGDACGRVPAIDVSVVDRLGAGDAFAAGVIDGMLDGDLAMGVRRGVALAAVALGTRGDQIAISRAELDAFMGGPGGGVDR